MKNYYVYKYVVSNEIIYIGLTDNLQRRIKEHASGVGLEEKFLPYLNDAIIYYHKCGNETEMRALESLLINHYKPILNVVDVGPGESTVTTNIDWQIYCEEQFSDHLTYDLQKYQRLLKSNKTRIQNYQTKQEELTMRMNNLRPFYSQINNYLDYLAKNPYATLSIPRRHIPKEDFLFVATRLVPIWYDEQDLQGDMCLVQLSGEFLRELFAVGHQDDWIEQTMNMVGNDECRSLAIKIANLSATNTKLERKIKLLKSQIANIEFNISELEKSSD